MSGNVFEYVEPEQKYDRTMMATAELWAKHGTCSRMQVGVVFAKESRILVQGYNGAPKGLTHCDHECNCDEFIARFPNVMFMEEGHFQDCKSQQPCDWAVHAEQNGIAWAARTGVSLDGSTAYSTHQPCAVCARLIITSGVARVVYKHPYRRSEGLELLREASVRVLKLEAAERSLGIPE